MAAFSSNNLTSESLYIIKYERETKEGIKYVQYRSPLYGRNSYGRNARYLLHVKFRNGILEGVVLGKTSRVRVTKASITTDGVKPVLIIHEFEVLSVTNKELELDNNQPVDEVFL